MGRACPDGSRICTCQALTNMANSTAATDHPQAALPKGPVFGWTSFQRVDAPGIPSVESLPHTAITTSGRSAIFQALLQLQLPAGSSVLVPTYNCPTMVAPVLLAKLNVTYFGLRPDGLPNLATIDSATTAKAILVPHYFGLAKSLAEVRQWCDHRGIALIEDCAHCYFGDAGERQVGEWGDYATASLSKFLPVPEGGLLGSSRYSIKPLELAPQGFKAQLKGWLDVLELASKYKRLSGINKIMAGLFWLKNSRDITQATPLANVMPCATLQTPSAATLMRDSDMERIALAPLAATQMLKALLPRGRIITRRQHNFATYAGFFSNVKGARPLFPLPLKAVAPYVFPLWVDNAEHVYREIRALALPVFRWDRIWPGTPQLDGDVGPLWSQHVLQLLCHQDLDEADIKRTAFAILKLLGADSRPAPSADHTEETHVNPYSNSLGKPCSICPATQRQTPSGLGLPEC